MVLGEKSVFGNSFGNISLANPLGGRPRPGKKAVEKRREKEEALAAAASAMLQVGFWRFGKSYNAIYCHHYYEPSSFVIDDFFFIIYCIFVLLMIYYLLFIQFWFKQFIYHWYFIIQITRQG